MDLFEREQQIFDSFIGRIAEIHRGAKLAIQDYVKVAEEYGKLLKQLRGFLEGNFDFADKINYDVLTGIYNKRYLRDSLKRIIASAARHSTEQLTVMMLSIDYFKLFTDKYGKGESQNCLKSIAKMIAASVPRVGDFAARYGDEEFVVVLPNTDERGARRVANRILENVRSLRIKHEKSEISNYVTLSIGVITGNIEHSQNGNDYIKSAEEALQLSKQGGCDRYTYMNLRE